VSAFVAIASILAAYVAINFSPHKAFLNVYLPFLLLVPSYYQWNMPVLPDPNFQQAAIIPIFAIWLSRGTPGWKSSYADVLVFGFGLSMGVSEFINAGYKEAQNLMFDVVGSMFLPYVLAKSLVEPAGLRIVFGKRIVILLVIVSFFLLHHFITGSRYTIYHKIFGIIFPGQGWAWPTSYRWGLPRASGPYAHAILAGIIMIIGYRLQRWLEWSKAWPRRLNGFEWIPISTSRLFTLILFMGATLTLVRGPISGGIVAAVIVLVGRSKRRWLIFTLILIFFILVTPPTVAWFIDYASVGRMAAASESQETFAYRWELIVNYFDVAMEKFVWGWGRNTWPKHPEQPSIDNYYLLLFLMHGFMGVGFLFAILLVMPARLFIYSMFQPVAHPSGSSLGFTLLSVYIVVGWSIATVYLGEQTIPLLFLLVGWSEGYLLYDRQQTQTKGDDPPPDNRIFKFKRVLS